ncbi:MAG: response regulator transcription factor [Suipraeoptans sp.]
MTYKVLAADDELELLDALELFFNKENIEIIKAKSGKEAIRLFAASGPHLVLLDIMMPEMDGYEVLKKIRETSNIPAILLTAKSQDYDKILGLELGADDYITKPYNPMEVVARVKAQLRRFYAYGSDVKTSEITICDLVLKLDEGVVEKNGQLIQLTGTEFHILELLMKNPGRIYTKQQIFNYAWEDSYMGDDNTVMVHISNIRSKIENDPKEPKMLKTIKGLGYKFDKE